MYGMRSSIFCPRKSHVILRDIQLSRLDRYWMVFCLYSGLVANGSRYYPKNMVLVLPVIVGFSNGLGWEYFSKKLWVRLLLKIYDDIRGINWRWQSLDSASIKAPLDGTGLVVIPQTEEAS
jgi:hypothetical protein